jgi:hypothetical protein
MVREDRVMMWGVAVVVVATFLAVSFILVLAGRL